MAVDIIPRPVEGPRVRGSLIWAVWQQDLQWSRGYVADPRCQTSLSPLALATGIRRRHVASPPLLLELLHCLYLPVDPPEIGTSGTGYY
jgi:hypothetical protein